MVTNPLHYAKVSQTGEMREGAAASNIKNLELGSSETQEAGHGHENTLQNPRLTPPPPPDFQELSRLTNMKIGNFLLVAKMHLGTFSLVTKMQLGTFFAQTGNFRRQAPTGEGQGKPPPRVRRVAIPLPRRYLPSHL